MNNCECLKPSINNNSSILILGSMPGDKSLEMQQYYAHKQNRFWKLMGALCQYEDLHKESYEKRLKILLDKNFALWDVIESCLREGSSDSKIIDVIPNKIIELTEEYQNIQIICLNGGTAAKFFKKHFPRLCNSQKIKIKELPSTSSANAQYSLDKLILLWRNAIFE